jgi:hypothetical protein
MLADATDLVIPDGYVALARVLKATPQRSRPTSILAALSQRFENLGALSALIKNKLESAVYQVKLGRKCLPRRKA